MKKLLLILILLSVNLITADTLEIGNGNNAMFVGQPSLYYDGDRSMIAHEWWFGSEAYSGSCDTFITNNGDSSDKLTLRNKGINYTCGNGAIGIGFRGIQTGNGIEPCSTHFSTIRADTFSIFCVGVFNDTGLADWQELFAYGDITPNIRAFMEIAGGGAHQMIFQSDPDGGPANQAQVNNICAPGEPYYIGVFAYRHDTDSSKVVFTVNGEVKVTHDDSVFHSNRFSNIYIGSNRTGGTQGEATIEYLCINIYDGLGWTLAQCSSHVNILTDYYQQKLADRDAEQTIHFGDKTDPTVPRSANVVGFWKMDSDSTDETGNHDFFRVNEVTYQTSKTGFGEACSLDGVNDWDSVAHHADFNFERTDLFSLCAWVKTKNSGSNNAISCKWEATGDNQGYNMRIRNTGYLDFHIRQNASKYIRAYGNATRIDDGQWHFVVCTYDGSSNVSGMNLYIDNNSESVTTEAPVAMDGTIQNTNPLNIGSEKNGSNYFSGYIDCVMIYNVELSSSEIDELWDIQGKIKRQGGL